MSNTLFIETPRVDSGLQTATYTVPTGGAGPYVVNFACTEYPPTSLAVVVQVNAVTKYTMPTITPTQTEQKFSVDLLLADADVVTVVMTSTDDATLNSLKSTVSIGKGY